MAHEVLDIYVEQGYQYPYYLDYNDALDGDLEPEYTCNFVSDSIGTKAFSNVNGRYELILLSSDTAKLETNLEPYTIYVTNRTTGVKDKLLTGRIILNRA